MREAIDGVYADHRRYPERLEVLVENRCLRQIPVDPFTRRANTWVVVAAEDEGGGVFDVHSGTDLVVLGHPMGRKTRPEMVGGAIPKRWSVAADGGAEKAHGCTARAPPALRLEA
jgi:hypothetical protein